MKTVLRWVIPLAIPFIVIGMARLCFLALGVPWEPTPDAAAAVTLVGIFVALGWAVFYG